jgi:lipopolysaccharide transport system permease protein
MARNLWRHRELLARLTAQDVTQRYRGSYLGTLWSVITPFVTLAAYAFVFSVVFRVRWGPADGASRPGEFALVLFAGLIPFHVLAEVMSRAPSVVLAVPNYVKKVVFPLEILPVVTVGSAVVHSLISVGILLVAGWAFLGAVPVTVALLPLAYLPLVLLSLGLGWFLGALGVYVRDVGQAVGVVIQVLLFVSPIFYPTTAVPEAFRPALYANPLTSIVGEFRRTLLWGGPLDWAPWGGLLLLTAAVALLGYAWFMQTKKGFADVM